MSAKFIWKISFFWFLLLFINLLASFGAGQTLTDGEWKLTGYSFRDSRVFPIDQMDVNLTVSPNMRVGGKAGCNIFGGTISFEHDGTIEIGPLTSTEMACDDIRAPFETLFLQTLENVSVYTIERGKLTLTDTRTNTYLQFERKGAATKLILYVSNKMVKCAGIAPMKCLRTKQDINGGWQNFYDSIRGFKFIPGRFYKIEVERSKAEDVPADSNTVRYNLVRVIKSVRKQRLL